MNCANHPESPVSAYCQNCGKPLCTECVRSVAGIIYCEPCLAARIAATGATAPGAGVPSGAPGGVPGAGVPPPVQFDSGPNPGLAAFLGFIPGVGAMYNGQFVKGLAHVLIFVLLVSLADEHGVFGLFIAAWIFYQVFDAYQTAKARRDGLPLPNPFGLNDLGARLGLHPAQPAPGAPPSTPYSAGPAYPPPPGPGTAGFTAAPEVYPPASESYPPGAYPPPPPVGSSCRHRPEPVGAIILIALGALFLLQSLHIFAWGWIGHGWPLILVGLGVWLLVRRLREPENGGHNESL